MMVNEHFGYVSPTCRVAPPESYLSVPPARCRVHERRGNRGLPDSLLENVQVALC